MTKIPDRRLPPVVSPSIDRVKVPVTLDPREWQLPGDGEGRRQVEGPTLKQVVDGWSEIPERGMRPVGRCPPDGFDHGHQVKHRRHHHPRPGPVTVSNPVLQPAPESVTVHQATSGPEIPEQLVGKRGDELQKAFAYAAARGDSWARDLQDFGEAELKRYMATIDVSGDPQEARDRYLASRAADGEPWAVLLSGQQSKVTRGPRIDFEPPIRVDPPYRDPEPDMPRVEIRLPKGLPPEWEAVLNGSPVKKGED